MVSRARSLAVLLVGLLGLGSLSVARPASATSYPAVSFDDLVTRADVIFIGEVVDVRPFPVETREGTIVKTRVVFRVADPLWGTSSAVETFDFFGGEWNGVAMGITGIPTFAVGDRRVVFARRTRSINPIVGFTQGLMQISRDTDGVDRVMTVAGEPVSSPESIGTRQRTPAARPMRLADLSARIRTRVAAVRGR